MSGRRLQSSDSLSQAVLRTQAYAEVFAAPLSLRRMWRWLIAPDRVSVVQTSKTALALGVSLIEPSFEHQRTQHKKWLEVTRIVQWLRWVPWVQSIWITGSLAADNAQEDEDIDLLFITDTNRLWLARACVVGLALLLGRYRSFYQSETKMKNRWCCNLWLEARALALTPQRQTLYTARELVQARPVYERAPGLAVRFIRANSWVKHWCANGFQQSLQQTSRLSTLPYGPQLSPPAWLGRLLSPVLFVLNQGVQFLQQQTMRRHRTREVVRTDQAFFHPRDTASWVLGRYEKICRHYGVSPWPTEQ